MWKPVLDDIFDFKIVFVYGCTLLSMSIFKTSYGFNVLKLESLGADIRGISILDKFLNELLLFLFENLLFEGIAASLTVLRLAEFN